MKTNKIMKSLLEARNPTNDIPNAEILKLLGMPKDRSTSMYIELNELPFRVLNASEWNDTHGNKTSNLIAGNNNRPNGIYIEYTGDAASRFDDARWARDSKQKPMTPEIVLGGAIMLNGKVLKAQDSPLADKLNVDFYSILTSDRPDEISTNTRPRELDSIELQKAYGKAAKRSKEGTEELEADLPFQLRKALDQVQNQLCSAVGNKIYILTREEAKHAVLVNRKAELNSKVNIKEKTFTVNSTDFINTKFRHLVLREAESEYTVILIDYTFIVGAPTIGFAIQKGYANTFYSMIEPPNVIFGELDAQRKRDRITVDQMRAAAAFIKQQ